MGSKLPVTRVSYVKTKQNIDEVDDWKRDESLFKLNEDDLNG